MNLCLEFRFGVYWLHAGLYKPLYIQNKAVNPAQTCTRLSRSLTCLWQKCQVFLRNSNHFYFSSCCFLHSYKWIDIPLFKVSPKAMILQEVWLLECTIFIGKKSQIFLLSPPNRISPLEFMLAIFLYRTHIFYYQFRFLLLED